MGVAGKSPIVWTRWSLFALGLLWTAWSSLVPVSALPSVTVWDKAAHAVNYGVLTFLLAYALAWQRPWGAAGWVVAYGILIEVAQALTGHRTGDWHDALANGIGAACAAIALKLGHGLRERRSGIG